MCVGVIFRVVPAAERIAVTLHYDRGLRILFGVNSRLAFFDELRRYVSTAFAVFVENEPVTFRRVGVQVNIAFYPCPRRSFVNIFVNVYTVYRIGLECAARSCISSTGIYTDKVSFCIVIKVIASSGFVTRFELPAFKVLELTVRNIVQSYLIIKLGLRAVSSLHNIIAAEADVAGFVEIRYGELLIKHCVEIHNQKVSPNALFRL